MTDPRDLPEATDDELRAAHAAAQVRIHRTRESDVAIPEDHATAAPVPDPRDLSQATDDEARAAAAAKSVRVERSAERDPDTTTGVEPDRRG